MKSVVLGSGRWASFLAWYLDRIGHNTMLWGRPGSENFRELKENRRNSYIELPESVILTNALEEAVSFGDFIFVAIAAQQLRGLCQDLKKFKPSKPFVLCMKGLEENTGLRLSQIIKQELPEINAAVWVGPGHPQDFVREIPNCMVIDSENPQLVKNLADMLSSPLIRFYYGEDIIGTEVGAAAKNVVGIAAGMLDGLGCGALKGVLMARAAREVSRLAGAMGGNELTVYGICHLGDYEATLFSPHSRNRKYGEMIINGKSDNKLAEGVSTAFSMMKLAETYNVDLPICAAVVKAIDGESDPKNSLIELFERDLKSEFYSSNI